jgi:hypothetical protein
MRSETLDGLGLTPHHGRAIERLVAALESDPETQALLLAGSLAHGYARPDSDVDVLLVVDHASMERHVRERRLTWADRSYCDWEGGYVDAKYVDSELLEQVADHGSEPARFAYQGARVLFDRSTGLDDLLERITRYPIEGRDDRVTRFTAQLLAWRWYHSEGVRQASPYLGALARQKLVLFTCRIVLARNARLYPFHKWLLAETERATDRPATLMEDIDRLLREPDQDRVARLVTDVLDWYNIDEAAANASWPTLYMEDTELSWLGGRPPIDDI